MNTKISYRSTQEAWEEYPVFVKNLIETYSIRTICDIGGGANPLLDLDYIERKHLDYTVLDISEKELEKAPKQYSKINCNIADKNFNLERRFDFAFSKMLAEHTKDAAKFHKNVFTLLNPGGIAVHFFPTLYTLPFFINRIFPDEITQKLLDLFSPRDSYQYSKFPAYYKWCRGPSKKQIKKIEKLGYRVMEYRGFFGHRNYYKKVKPLLKLHEIKTNYLLKNPNPLFTSFAYLVLQKPQKEG